MKNFILKGGPRRVPKIDKGVGEYFFEQVEIYGDKIFQIDGHSGKTETYHDVRQRSTRVAIHLQKMGIKQKDIIMICCRNNTDNIIPALAALYSGVYVASIDPSQTVSDVEHALTLVEPKVIFVEENSLPLVEEALKHFHFDPKIVCIGNSGKYVSMDDQKIETAEDKSFKPIKQKGTDTAVILFSSGTTSAPKGIRISNSCILNSFKRSIQHNNCKPEVVFHSSSFYWTSAWLLTGMIISTGTAKVVAPAITGAKLLEYVEKYKISFVATSSMLTYGITDLAEEDIKKCDTSSLYSMCVGGSTIDPQHILRLRKLLPHTYVAMAYGSSEASVEVFHDFTNRKAYQEKVSSSGTVLPETELKVVDLETGKLLGPNQEGEIYIKSPYSMSGYHNFEKQGTFDEDGFLKMGDIGYYDEDQYIYVTDRIGEMFKYRTNHLSPSVLEFILLGHPSVAEAVAFGVFHPIDRNHPGACVVLKKGANTPVQELLDFVNSKVSDPYRLRAGLRIVKSISKTPTGKIQRRMIRDLFIKDNREN